MKRLLLWILALALFLSAVPCALASSDSVTASTPLHAADDAQRVNISLACDSVACGSLDHGDVFSFMDLVGPRIADPGYQTGLNGRGVPVVGGGVAQVATTLYLALLQLDDIEYNSLYFYGQSYAGSYVSDGYYAVLTDYNEHVDFSFTSYYDGLLTIYLWMDDSHVTCLIVRDNGSVDQMISSASTPLYGADAKRNNVSLASSSIFGVSLKQYDMFSFNGLVGPRAPQYGYAAAINGRGVSVVGGGVAQVASTVYLAVKDLPCVTIAEKKTYANFTEHYVSDPDAAILTDYTNGVDFSFYYTGEGTLTLYTYVTENECICEVYEE